MVNEIRSYLNNFAPFPSTFDICVVKYLTMVVRISRGKVACHGHKTCIFHSFLYWIRRNYSQIRHMSGEYLQLQAYEHLWNTVWNQLSPCLRNIQSFIHLISCLPNQLRLFGKLLMTYINNTHWRKASS